MNSRTIFFYFIFFVGYISLVPSTSYGVWFAAESVENFSGCGCTGPDLDWCNDQAESFVDRMNDSPVWSYDFWFEDSNAWARDFIEDEMTYDGQYGEDAYFSDYRARIMFVSGHGRVIRDGDESYFRGYLCDAPFGSCTFQSDHMKLGERSGAFSDPNWGLSTYLAMHMCHSVEYSVANSQWFRIVDREVADFHMALGLDGVGTDAESLSQVGYDFADKAEHSSWSLKAAWWYAIEDYWHDDTGAIITWGHDRDDAVGRRDNETFWIDPFKMFDDYGTAAWWASSKHGG